eukprot:CAMPEP_0114996914 /NCGR_PEP_ID=MMETSP0216-20121206/14595_1 /TAXON_ID=223996 /ORGANISM="Protocruzia adherens, Strain Boccale" /LENGTH=242 /DNA_ID=CAMNT_0002361211 /DNA_START=31 /DNA_END=759 /DNA_ORIENTATION=+
MASDWKSLTTELGILKRKLAQMDDPSPLRRLISDFVYKVKFALDDTTSVQESNRLEDIMMRAQNLELDLDRKCREAGLMTISPETSEKEKERELELCQDQELIFDHSKLQSYDADTDLDTREEISKLAKQCHEVATFTKELAKDTAQQGQGLDEAEFQLESSKIQTKEAGIHLVEAAKHDTKTWKQKFRAFFAGVGGVIGVATGGVAGGAVGVAVGGVAGHGIATTGEKSYRKKLDKIEFKG